MTEEERKTFEAALKTAWKNYVDRGAATVDALEDNTQELAFAKGFKAGCEQGYKDAVIKACEYLKTNHVEMWLRYIRGYEIEYDIELFKKYMEGQQ